MKMGCSQAPLGEKNSFQSKQNIKQKWIVKCYWGKLQRLTRKIPSNLMQHIHILIYSRTSPYWHLSNTDSSLGPGKMPIHFCKNNLYNTDNDTKSRSQRENSYKLNLFITDTPMMTVLIQHDFLFIVTYQSVINCLIFHTITVSCFQSVKII